MSDDFTALLNRFTAAVEAPDGAALASLFTYDGVYHDTFYGVFQGRAAIASMLEDNFWGDAEAFLWDIYEPAYDSGTRTGYARWVFSYTATLEESAGKRVAFDGMSQFTLENGLIRLYREVFSAGLAFTQLGIAPARTNKIFRRMVDAHIEDPDWARHLSGP